METVEEKRWEYEVVEVGQKGTPFTVEVTQDLISKYAQRVRNPNPAYQEDDDQLLAMPTMVIAAAPLRRFDVAEANGFVALELVQDSPRQTPFAKCEVRWHSPMRAGDTITSVCSVIDKYERRGSKFVTFRVEARNQHDEMVAEYDYTSIFEYAKGQKQAADQAKAAEATRQ